MLFVFTPQNNSSAHYDPEEAFLEYKRREYIAALQEQQQRAQFERELAIEEERHRIALATIARQEAARRQYQASARFSQHSSEAPCQQRRFCGQPAPEEIFARRLARQQEEERRSRQFHEHILSQVFGVPTGQTSSQPAAAEAPKASTSNSADKGKQSTAKRPFNAPEPEPHWSAAPERARSLQEITSINRTFASLKNTFSFPSGPLERLPESDLPRLAYNSVNASIHAYEHALSELLTKLDGIESHGFKGVREARKQLVVRIGKELEELEQKIAERLSESASPAMVPVAVPEVQEKEVEDVVMQDDQNATATTSTNTEAAVAADVTLGYDVEPEEVPQDLTIAVEEPASEKTTPTAVSQDMEVESAEVPQSVPAAADEKETPSSPAPTPVAAPTQQPAPSEVRDASGKSASAVLLEESSSSDEESEIEDAVHIDLDEAVAHDQRDAHATSDHEVEYELI